MSDIRDGFSKVVQSAAKSIGKKFAFFGLICAAHWNDFFWSFPIDSNRSDARLDFLTLIRNQGEKNEDTSSAFYFFEEMMDEILLMGLEGLDFYISPTVNEAIKHLIDQLRKQTPRIIEAHGGRLNVIAVEQIEKVPHNFAVIQSPGPLYYLV